jgi:hypothetical protein
MSVVKVSKSFNEERAEFFFSTNSAWRAGYPQAKE